MESNTSPNTFFGLASERVESPLLRKTQPWEEQSWRSWVMNYQVQSEGTQIGSKSGFWKEFQTEDRNASSIRHIC